jgi:glycosyltransferase A (GT-A) superfamily protein (DUF2064 family)
MSTRRNALLLFCKPPVPGLVKTRLTKERGGNLSAEQAAEFFRCSLLDIIDLGLLSLEHLCKEAGGAQSYDMVVSTISKEAILALRQLFAENDMEPRTLSFIVDKGASFDDHFDDAFNQLFAAGYNKVVAIGGDMPTLPQSHIIEAFNWLDYLEQQTPDGWAFVMAPCQQSGVSLVGQTATTPMNSQGVYYNLSGLPALDAYAAKVDEQNVPCAYLAPVSDVDEDHDLAHCISCLNAIAAAHLWQEGLYLPCRVLEWIDAQGLKASAPPNENHDPRQMIDL